jgi:uncharacterized protein YcaQ
MAATMSIKIDKKKARRFLVRYHSLNSYSELSGKQGVIDYIKRVGCIQYDPLNVVGRNPDLVLRARINRYRSDLLQSLLYDDRKLIDGWDKVMSIYHVEDWPCMAEVRKEAKEGIPRVLKHRKSLAALDALNEIRKELNRRGPLRSGQIKIGSVTPGRWGHRNAAGAAMDYMFRTGELGIYNKVNTQKVYEFTKNLLPPEIIDGNSLLPYEDFLPWYCVRRIGSVGLLWDKDGPAWFGTYIRDRDLRRAVLDQLQIEKKIFRVEIDGIQEDFFVRAPDHDLLMNDNISLASTVRILGPLDNLLWDRAMIKAVFGFDYSWEVYIPQQRRKYGYYVLPVLYRDAFVARAEMNKKRDDGKLNIVNWWWEEGATVSTRLKTEIVKELKRFAHYLSLDGIPDDFCMEMGEGS